ncbi:Transglutaminase-like superfamily protein [Flavobacteriaceae bacterium MAR_2010_188]|nr:Transglutaminase-like superfamily protein [Flavobacteriaceae bacterium MAR_2010_188]
MKKLLVVLFILPYTIFAQNFQDEDFIYLKRHEYIKVGLTGNEFNIAKNVSEQAEYLTSKKLFFANERMQFDSFSSIENIEAYTTIPSTGRKIDVDYIETKREFDNGIFYSDQESKNFTFPAVTKGAITNLSYTELIKDPHFLGMFRFGSFVPTKSAQLAIEFPKNVNIGYIDFNTSEIDLDFKKEELTDKNIYTWTAKNIEGFEGEENSESALYYLPHIIVYIKNYKEDGKTVNVLNDVADLYKWYNSLVDQIDETALENVHNLALDITKNATTKRDKAKAIFNWVQDNITYVAFEDGLGGFVPRGAASVCDKRYGDCKDMANLLYEMLNQVGIETYRTWIGTRDRQYSYLEVPTPMVDNHMIATAVIENDTIFLDATDSYVPFGMPSAFIQTKEALLGIDKDNYKVIKVPVATTDESVTKVFTEMNLDDDALTVKEKRVFTGYDKVEFVSGYKYRKADKSDEEYLNTTLAIGNNKTNYSNISIGSLNHKLNDLEIKYDLNINNYSRKIGDKVYLNLNIDKTLSNSNINIKTRKYSKKIDHKFKKEFETTFNIPEGYKVSDLPETLTFDNPDFNFNISYKQEGNKIIQNKLLVINTLSIEKQDFDNWNDFIKSLLKAYNKSIILEKI